MMAPELAHKILFINGYASLLTTLRHFTGLHVGLANSCRITNLVVRLTLDLILLRYRHGRVNTEVIRSDVLSVIFVSCVTISYKIIHSSSLPFILFKDAGPSDRDDQKAPPRSPPD